MQPRYGLVGDGRLARHLHRYFGMRGIEHGRWSRRSCSGQSLADFSRDFPTLLLAVSDRAIEPLASQISPKKQVIHFSGALYSKRAFGFHPLFTFGEQTYPLETYEAVPLVIDEGAPPFSEVFPELKNPSFSLEPSKKALYHSLCVLSGNFTVFLWSYFFERMKSDLGLPPEAALPYLRQTAGNLAANTDEPRRIWSGPLVRNDRETIEKNLTALEGSPYQEVYRVFLKCVSPTLPTLPTLEDTHERP